MQSKLYADNKYVQTTRTGLVLHQQTPPECLTFSSAKAELLNTVPEHHQGKRSKQKHHKYRLLFQKAKT